jgi:hypothetical protein
MGFNSFLHWWVKKDNLFSEELVKHYISLSFPCLKTFLAFLDPDSQSEPEIVNI